MRGAYANRCNLLPTVAVPAAQLQALERTFSRFYIHQTWLARTDFGYKIRLLHAETASGFRRDSRQGTCRKAA